MSASQKRHGPETQVRRRKGWQLGAFALGLAILAYAVSSAFDGASTFYSNLGSLSQSRGLLESDSQDRDALLGTAASHFQEALRWNPENSRAFHNLGLIALSQGQKLTAQAAFEKAVDLAPGSRLSHHHLAMLYYDLGLEDKAIDAWQRAGAAAWLVREGLRCRQEYDENCAERFYKLAGHAGLQG